MATVYFIQSGDLIKIGRVSRLTSLPTRIGTLRNSSSQPITVLGIIYNCSPKMESSLHWKFSALRCHGEWFKTTPELLSFIKKNTSPYIDGQSKTRVITKYGDSTLTTWLVEELKKREWQPSDLARKANLGNSTVQRIIAGTRTAGRDVCVKIAFALSETPEKVMRVAGLLPNIDIEAAIEDELLQVVSRLSPDDQVEVLRYAKYRQFIKESQ